MVSEEMAERYAEATAKMLRELGVEEDRVERAREWVKERWKKGEEKFLEVV
jgi:hypothetical protein